MIAPRRTLPRCALRITAVATSGLLLTMPVAVTTAAPAPASTPGAHTRLVAHVGPRDSSFAESVAVNSRGGMFVSRTVWGQANNVGRIMRVRPSGERHPFGPRFRLGPTGMLVGVAVNGRDQVFVAHYDFGGSVPSEIVRVTATRLQTVATLPAGAWPNGLTFHRGLLYVGDAALGDVWRFRPSDTPRDLTRPWLHDVRLEPAAGESIGVNGLAFWGDHLFAVNYTRDTLLRVRLDADGGNGPVQRVARRARLHTADGIAFDRRGLLWVTVNGIGPLGKRPHDQYLLRLTRGGVVRAAVKDAAWMNYPTMVVRGRTPATADRMFVTDGAFNGGVPDLRTFRLR